ncbi:MAG TPA: efflux RND transporter permease subunit [Methylocella sp.]|nr:efflux RND transporter permease subunit [Methylocella sp.]
MNLSAPFIRRPVATTLLTLAVALAGVLAFTKLPAAPMPEVDLPAISVDASMPGASPEVMASAVATPLERHLSAIAGVADMSSINWTGGTVILLTFDLNRDLDGAARDVQAAINAARADLPAALSGNPSYSKSNIAFLPITYLSLTSATLSVAQVFDIAATVLQPQLASIQGVGRADVLGSSPLAVRVELNPDALTKYGIGLEDVRAALAAANANSPKGAIQSSGRRFQIYTNDQVRKAKDYRNLVIAYRNGSAVRLVDVAEVVDSVENPLAAAVTDGKASILLRIYRIPGAHVIETVDRIKARLAELRAALPAAVDIAIVSDRTATTRASLRDLEHALLIAGALVILTVFAFLRSVRAIVIPAIVVPVSILGTFGIMYLFKYSLDSLSLMALIIATGLVIDDSVIVLENISRHIESALPRLQATRRGAREVGFTVLAMSLALVAIFIPFLFMGDVIGRILREFAVTLSAAVVISLAISLATAPMLCAHVLEPRSDRRPRGLARIFEHPYKVTLQAYEKTLAVALRHSRLTLAVLLAVTGLNVYLYSVVPKGLLPQQDPEWLMGWLIADPNISAELMKRALEETSATVLADPAVRSTDAMIEFAKLNWAEFHIFLKPQAQRKESSSEVKSRLAAAISEIPGRQLFLSAVQDISLHAPAGYGGRYQYVLQGDDSGEILTWAIRLNEALKHVPEVLDPQVDDKDQGLDAFCVIDRDTMSRLGIAMSQIDNTLYDAFGQRQVSTIFAPLNQYHVVMEVAPRYRQNPEVLDKIYISTSGGAASGVQLTNAPAGTVSGQQAQPTASKVAAVASDAARNQNLNRLANTGGGLTSTGAAVSTAAETTVPLSAIARLERVLAPLGVNHRGNFVAAQISFDLPPKVPLREAMAAIARTKAEIHMPASIHGSFSGEAKAFQQTLLREVILILAAIASIYIVLGILYESFIHPVTILSTLPPAGAGAILALMAAGLEFTVIAFIGVILLIGIVMKNAIMMIDVAVDLERSEGFLPQEAIHRACLQRFRPIMMTTFAALFGALPLALGMGMGAELRQPLGISIIGGLIVSQALTLYTTPAVYLQLDRLRGWLERSGQTASSQRRRR